ncbi:TPA: hypothetical protein ACI7LL_004820, partial [Escherichia coli]
TPAHCGQETLHMPLIQLNYLLYVVLIPLSLTRRAGPEKTASLIPCAWYTSGKSRIDKKSDLPETAIR